MSTIPGYTLEAFLAWNYDIVVQDEPDPNPSLMIAEAMGTASQRRPVLTKEHFAQVVELFEDHRNGIEDWLDSFDPETQSWRTYSCYGYGGECVPDALYERGRQLIERFKTASQ